MYCRCSYGTPALDCDSANQHKCRSCDDGWWLNPVSLKCQPKRNKASYCRFGGAYWRDDEAVWAHNLVASEKIQSCSEGRCFTGYHNEYTSVAASRFRKEEHTCEWNICHCSFGFGKGTPTGNQVQRNNRVPGVQMYCPIHNDYDCAGCIDGYELLRNAATGKHYCERREFEFAGHVRLSQKQYRCEYGDWMFNFIVTDRIQPILDRKSILQHHIEVLNIIKRHPCHKCRCRSFWCKIRRWFVRNMCNGCHHLERIQNTFREELDRVNQHLAHYQALFLQFSNIYQCRVNGFVQVLITDPFLDRYWAYASDTRSGRTLDQSKVDTQTVKAICEASGFGSNSWFYGEARSLKGYATGRTTEMSYWGNLAANRNYDRSYHGWNLASQTFYSTAHVRQTYWNSYHDTYWRMLSQTPNWSRTSSVIMMDNLRCARNSRISDCEYDLGIPESTVNMPRYQARGFEYVRSFADKLRTSSNDFMYIQCYTNGGAGDTVNRRLNRIRNQYPHWYW